MNMTNPDAVRQHREDLQLPLNPSTIVGASQALDDILDEVRSLRAANQQLMDENACLQDDLSYAMNTLRDIHDRIVTLFEQMP
jgi:hypothetical protein